MSVKKIVDQKKLIEKIPLKDPIFIKFKDQQSCL